MHILIMLNNYLIFLQKIMLYKLQVMKSEHKEFNLSGAV